MDGADVLFRVALAILTMCEEELLLCSSMPSVYIALKSLPTRIWQVEKLIQVQMPSKNCLQVLTDELQIEGEFRSKIIHSEVLGRRNARVKELREMLGGGHE